MPVEQSFQWSCWRAHDGLIGKDCNIGWTFPALNTQCGHPYVHQKKSVVHAQLPPMTKKGIRTILKMGHDQEQGFFLRGERLA